MGTEMLQTSRLKSGGDENNLHKQSCHGHCQSSVCCLHGSHETLVPKGMNDILCPEENCQEHHSSGMPSRDIADDISEAMHPDVIPKNLRQQKELTLQDMYYQKEDYDDDDDDLDWDPLAKPVNSKEEDYDDNDEDDDWEALATRVDSKKWFCTNCTMKNFDDVFHCDVCGECKDSEIVRPGLFASHLARETSHAQVKSEVVCKYEDSCKQKQALENCTAVGFDERMLLHSEVQMNSHPHPERPDRLRAIAASLANAGIFPGRCIPIPAREITQEELQRVHSLEHIEAVKLTSCMLSSYFTADTYANEHSACAARLAAGLCADLSLAIMSGQAKNGFALVRPPGHHAGVKRAMGFCLHNNAAVAALAAQGANAKKVLIVDWDVHHGNGTQEIFEGNKSVLYISLHRHDGGRFYPGTGAADEVGIMGAKGYCVNVPWKHGGIGDNDYVFAFQHIVLPIASEFSPDLTIISAGFDAARGDPLGCCDVTPAGFAQMTHMLKALSSGKLLVILEGGYNLRSISSSATAVIKVLLGESPGFELDGIVPSKTGLQTVLEVLKIQMKFWPNLESIFTTLQPKGASFSIQNMKKRIKKRRQVFVPVWWKWGRKRLIYNLLYAQLRFKPKRRAKSLS